PDGGGAIDGRVLYCVTAQACGLVSPRTFSACVSTVDGPPVVEQRCLAAAGSDCAAARACTYDATHPSLCAVGAAPRCDGDLALMCDGKTTTTSESDCSLAGAVCLTSATAARCALARCDAPGAVSYCQGEV